MNSEEDVVNKEPSYTVGGNVNWSNFYGEQCRNSLKKLKLALPYDQVIPLLDMYPEKIILQKRYMHPSVQLKYCLQWPRYGSVLTSINRGMYNEGVLYVNNGILVSHKKE